MSCLPYEFANARGFAVKALKKVHAKYGETVRIAPEIVVFNRPDAWEDIYAQKPGKPIFPKDPARYTHDLWINGYPEVFTALDSDHSRLRRALQPAFSDKFISDHEPLVQKNRATPHTATVDINEWMNWVMFDLIGDLAFGETFECLEQVRYHPWVALILKSVKAVSITGAIKQWPWLDAVWQLLISGIWMRALRGHHVLAIDKINRRLERDTMRNDFIQLVLNHEGTKREISQGELYSNMALLIMSGSDSSSSTLVGMLYNLSRNTHILASLQKEIREKCPIEKDLTFKKLNDLPNLTAALKESMRIYPATPVMTPRKVSKGGAVVAGTRLPEGVTVGVFQSAAYRSEINLNAPLTFDPTRWQGNPVYEHDRRDIFKPFGLGPKNCIGQQLAMTEIQLILARVLWNFDFELAEPTFIWTDQEVHWWWIRPPLKFKLSNRGDMEAPSLA